MPKNDPGNLWRAFYINENGEAIDATCDDRIFDVWYVDQEDILRWVFH